MTALAGLEPASHGARGGAAAPPAPDGGRSRDGAARRRLWLALSLGLSLLTLAGFLPVLRNGFVNFDDPQYVYANPWVRQGVSAAGLRWALTAQVAGNWHPLTLASHMLDVQLFGLNPAGHHLTSLLLHLANVLLLFAVLRRMTGSPWRSAAVAALFAVHPTHVESVAWIAERKDLLCGFFWLLALGAYLRYASAPAAGRYLLVVLALAASLMAKPMAVSLPAVLLLLDFWPLGRWAAGGGEGGWQRRPLPGARPWRLIVEKLPLLAVAAAAGIVALRTQADPLASGATAPPALRWANALTSYATYLGKTLDPRHLTVFYPFAAVPFGRAAAAALLLLAITALTVWAARRAPYLTVGWLWFLVTLAPVIGVLQVGWQAFADRYTYLPSIGLFLAAVWGVADLAGLAGRRFFGRRLFGRRLSGRRPVGDRRLLHAGGAVAFALLLLGLTAMTRRQVGTWRDSSTLWNHALEVAESYLAHTNVAEELRARGDRAGALAHYRAAVRLAPRSPQAYAALGNALRSWGLPAAAQQPLRTALAIDPADERSRLILAMSLDDLGRPDLAIAELRRVAADHPDSFDAQAGLSDLLRRTGDVQAAAAHRRRAEALAASAKQLPR